MARCTLYQPLSSKSAKVRSETLGTVLLSAAMIWPSKSPAPCHARLGVHDARVPMAEGRPITTLLFQRDASHACHSRAKASPASERLAAEVALRHLPQAVWLSQPAPSHRTLGNTTKWRFWPSTVASRMVLLLATHTPPSSGGKPLSRSRGVRGRPSASRNQGKSDEEKAMACRISWMATATSRCQFCPTRCGQKLMEPRGNDESY